MHVLHLTLASDAGGLSRYVADLSAATAAAGHRVTVAGDVGAWQWLFDAMPIDYVKIPLNRELLAFSRSRSALRAALGEAPVDIIHTHYRRATLLGRRLQRDWVALGRARPPLLYTLHLSHISLRWPRRWFSDFGDYTHAPSVDAREWLINDAGVAAERIALIPHGVDTQRFAPPSPQRRLAARAALNLTPSDLVVLFVGRLDHPKNEGWMLDVARAARKAGMPNVKVLLAGEGPHEQELIRRIYEMGLVDTVRLLGHVDTLPVYQAADALLLPSQREGFSLVCAEAMAVGLPVLRTRTSGTRELIVEGVTGKSVPINHGAFVVGAVDFLRDRAALIRMGRAARQRIEEHFTFDRQTSDMLKLYEQLESAASFADIKRQH
jgi:glycosyltransferase involved in cell wall biosynthesis